MRSVGVVVIDGALAEVCVACVVPGLSENITVRSYLGRFLEHSRLFHFINGGENEVWIGSADMMHRNLDKRVETLLRITKQETKSELLKYLDSLTNENFMAWFLQSNDTWDLRSHDALGNPLNELQETLLQGRW